MTPESMRQAIDDMAHQFMSDSQIAGKLGLTRSAVSYIRSIHKIPAGSKLGHHHRCKVGLGRSADEIKWDKNQRRWQEKAGSIWYGGR